MNKSLLFGLSVVSGFLLNGINFVTATAKTVNTVPKAIRGTYYNYQNHYQWAKLSISANRSSIKYPGEKTFILSPHAKTSAHKLSFQGNIKYFTLNSKIKVLADSPYPEDGFKLTNRKIKGKYYKIIRAYQGGYQWDFIKSHKVMNSYFKKAH